MIFMRVIVLFVLVVAILSSCSSTLTIINNTDKSLEVISVLNREDQSNLDLPFNSIVDKNLLNKPLEPNESVTTDKNGYMSIFAITEDKDYYIQNNISTRTLSIDQSNFYVTESIMLDIDEPEIVSIRISNQTDYAIEEIVLEMGRSGENVTETSNILNFWNLVFPQQETEIAYEYFGPSSNSIQAVIFRWTEGNDKMERRITEDLDDLIVLR